jgi:long-chain fatty acid transport protein
MNIKKSLVLAAAVAAAVAAPGAFATNGYFSHGYGIKAKSVGGAGIAMPQDALAAATNPAGMALVGNKVDFGLDWFSPKRATIHQAGSTGVTGIAANTYESSNNNFFIPEFGYNKAISGNSTLGVAVYANGGMNTDYGKIILGGGTTNTYSNLEQLFIAPTWATKSGDHAFGVSLLLAYQTFEARGLQGFNTHSADSGNLTDKGKDTSTGIGFKLGWTGQISPTVTLGAAYQPRLNMSKFSKYKGLFAEQGDFDIPETIGLGLAVKTTPTTTLAFDVSQIKYGSIKSIANPGTAFPSLAGTLLGNDNGSGFGWENQTVYKVGVIYQYSPTLQLRAGYNYAKMPFDSKNTYFNILAPATVEQHLTLGATWTLANKSELTVAYMHAFDKTRKGTSGGAGTVANPGYDIDLKMYQNSLGIAYGWKM